MRLLILLTCPKDCIFSAWFYYHAADKQTLKELNSVLSTFSATYFLTFVNVTADLADDRVLRENDPALTWLSFSALIRLTPRHLCARLHCFFPSLIRCAFVTSSTTHFSSAALFGV